MNIHAREREKERGWGEKRGEKEKEHVCNKEIYMCIKRATYKLANINLILIEAQSECTYFKILVIQSYRTL